jgi:hypothetical protein
MKLFADLTVLLAVLGIVGTILQLPERNVRARRLLWVLLALACAAGWFLHPAGERASADPVPPTSRVLPGVEPVAWLPPQAPQPGPQAAAPAPEAAPAAPAPVAPPPVPPPVRDEPPPPLCLRRAACAVWLTGEFSYCAARVERVEVPAAVRADLGHPFWRLNGPDLQAARLFQGVHYARRAAQLARFADGELVLWHFMPFAEQQLFPRCSRALAGHFERYRLLAGHLPEVFATDAEGRRLGYRDADEMDRRWPFEQLAQQIKAHEGAAVVAYYSRQRP